MLIHTKEKSVNFLNKKPKILKLNCTHCGAENSVELFAWIHEKAVETSGLQECWYCKKYFDWYKKWPRYNFKSMDKCEIEN